LPANASPVYQLSQSINRRTSVAKPLKVTAQALVDQARREITEYSARDAIELAKRPEVLLVDIRDPRELLREGKVPGALHAPRGMLEFWIDPESKYFKPVFGEDRTFVFFCAGGLRSALTAKTLQDMGLTPVAHIEGGFAAWRDAGGPVEAPPPKPAK
jgi:rhodanese-related sulfurtransferase